MKLSMLKALLGHRILRNDLQYIPKSNKIIEY